MPARYEISVEDFRALPAQAAGMLCGVDEAGRGALAGPVVAACVAFPSDVPVGLRDSKALSPKRREALYDQILAAGRVGVGVVDHDTIDRIGILAANFEAMAMALRALRGAHLVGRVVVDGNYIEDGFYREFSGQDLLLRCMVKADAHVLEVSAASIVAKVTRDRLMCELAPRFVQYGFEQNAGYPSPSHLGALKTHGPSAVHRHSFAPVASARAAARQSPVRQ